MRAMSAFRKLAVLLAQVLAQRLKPLRGVYQLYLALAVFRLAVGDHPDIRRNAGVVKHVQRQERRWPPASRSQ